MKPLPLPKSFDENEIAVIIVIIISFILFSMIPRRFPQSITILLLILPITTSRLLDKFLSSPDKDLYDVFDSTAFELFDLLSYVMYAPFGYFFIYLYDYWKPRGLWLVIYIMGWSTTAIGFEKLLHLFHVFTYKEFTFWQAFVFYVASQIITLLFFHSVVLLKNKS